MKLLSALCKKAAAAPTAGAGGRLPASPSSGSGGGGSTFVFNSARKEPEFAGAGYTVLHPALNPPGTAPAPPPGDPRGVQPQQPNGEGAAPPPVKPQPPPDPIPYILSDPAKRVGDISKRIAKIKLAMATGLGPLTPALDPSNPTGRDMRFPPVPTFSPFAPGSLGSSLYGTAKGLYGNLLARTYQPKPFATLTDRDSVFAAPYHQAADRLGANLGSPPNPFAGLARQVGTWLAGESAGPQMPEWSQPIVDAAPQAMQGLDSMISYAR